MLLSTSLKTPVGELSLIADEDILIAAGFSGIANLISRLDKHTTEQKLSKSSRIPIISDLISDYFDGDLNSLNGIRARQSGAKFSQDVWKVMRKIPAGKTISYSELAKRAGSEAAVRAAGTACGNNLIAPIIPCHRIVKSGGGLGNYGYGVKVKEWLLRHEGALK
ncbi:MAG: methylated-DNA--[protein]-cysteine S-methyltransferase [Actinobacteria bacterium]|nr:methylated-DNA--[protein]-cysteine S-methyltransferase [Actinomycetota bacterium]